MAPISLTDSSSTLKSAQKGPINGLQALWDPYKILDIYPNGPGFTCVGIALYSNERCRWRFIDESIRRNACRQLDLIALSRPSTVTRQSLELLADNILCHNHKRQMYDKVTDWDRLISKHLNQLSEARLAVPSEPQHGIQEVSLESAKEIEIESFRKEMGRLSIERDDFKNRCMKREAEVEKLHSQQDQSLQRFEQAEKRLKGKIVGLESTTRQSREDTAANLNDIASLNKQLADSQNYDTEKTAEIERLKNDLDGKKQASSQMESAHSTTVADLTKRLNDSNAQIARLENTTQALRESRAENKKRLSKSEQQNQRLRKQSGLAGFRNVVQLLLSKRQYERMAMENRTLSEEKARLTKRMENAEERLAAQDVSRDCPNKKIDVRSAD